MDQSVSFENEVTQQLLLLSHEGRISVHPKPNLNIRLSDGLLNLRFYSNSVKARVKLIHESTHGFCCSLGPKSSQAFDSRRQIAKHHESL